MDLVTWRPSTRVCYERDGSPPLAGIVGKGDPGRAAIVTIQCPDSPCSGTQSGPEPELRTRLICLGRFAHRGQITCMILRNLRYVA